jgi:hypothetical protein
LRLARATTPTEQAVLLKALGNSGHPLVLDACEAYILRPEREVRLAATACARLVPGPRADTVLAVGLRDAEDSVVAVALAGALHRPYSDVLLTPLSELALAGKSKSQRIGATQVLGAWMKVQPAVLAIINSVAQNDAEPELRTYAQTLLNQAG